MGLSSPTAIGRSVRCIWARRSCWTMCCQSAAADGLSTIGFHKNSKRSTIPDRDVEGVIMRCSWVFMIVAVVIGISAIAIQHSNGNGQHRHKRTNAAQVNSVAPLSAADEQKAVALYSRTCAACHGQRLEGVVGPSLVGVGSRYSLAKIERIAQRGKGKNKPVSMPAGLATPDQARLLARWLTAGPNVTAQAPVSHSSVEA